MKNLLLILLAVATLASCSPKTAQSDTEAVATEVAPAPADHAAYHSPNPDVQQRVFDYIMKKGVFYIATVDGDQPRVRPFGALHIFEGKLYIITGHIKRVSKQLAANPKPSYAHRATMSGYVSQRHSSRMSEWRQRRLFWMHTPIYAVHTTRMMTTLRSITSPMPQQHSVRSQHRMKR